MISVIVTYKIKGAFVEENKKNIQKFLDDFKKLEASDFKYSVYTKEDNLTFVHHSVYRNEEVQKRIFHRLKSSKE
jgi:hypothetical protein